MVEAPKPPRPDVRLESWEILWFDDRSSVWLVRENPARLGYDKHYWRYARPEDEAAANTRRAAA